MAAVLEGVVDGLNLVREKHPCWHVGHVSMLLLITTKAGIRQSRIEKELDMAQATVSRMVRTLRDQYGYVRTCPDPESHINILVFPTPAGTTFAKDLCALTLTGRTVSKGSLVKYPRLPVNENVGGLVRLTDLWKVAGRQKGKTPREWGLTAGAAFIRYAQQQHGSRPVWVVKQGGPQAGVYATREVATAYCEWLDPAYQMAVVRTFIDMQDWKPPR